jgi:hypothetical protein
MLTKLPFAWMDSAGTFHNVVANGQSFALVRNQNFEANPNINLGQGVGWALAADNLPANPIGFWVASSKNGPGAHTAPIYYLLASSTGTPTLYRGDGVVPGTTWVAVPGQPSNIVANGIKYRNGPVFVNPYDADVVYVLTSTGVVVSRNATSTNAVFQPDSALSNFLSANGTYSFKAGYPGADSTNVDAAIHNGGWPTETLSDMAFDQGDPSHVAASSPFTGVFANLGKGWLNLGQYLPKPLSPAVSVDIVDQRVYVGLMGRGVLRLDNIGAARER